MRLFRLLAVFTAFAAVACSGSSDHAGSGGSAGAGSTGAGASSATAGGGAVGGAGGDGVGGSASAGGSASGGAGGAGTGGATASGPGGAGAGGSSCPAPPAALPDGALTRFANNPLLRNGPEAYDADKTGPRVVRKEGPSTYRIWYEAVASGGLTKVGYATSTDGKSWVKQGTVLGPSAAWEGNEVSPNAMLLENGVYKLYYHAGGSQLGNRRIGYATSNDGLSWSKQAMPVLDLGAQGAFDDDEVAEPRVLRVGAEYRMYYTGRSSETGLTSLGVATSADGVSWTKSPSNPVLDAAAWGNFWGGAFFLEQGVFHLWHGVKNGDASSLHYKWSTDGFAWNEGANNPVLGQNPDANAADSGLVGDSVSGYRDGDEFRIMYTGFNWNLFGNQGRFEGICMASIAATCN